MTDQQHPITPPPELVEQLRNDAPHGIRDAGVTRERHLVFAAYRAGAGGVLEACCEWLRDAIHHGLGDEVGAMLADRLRAAMHPKPPSLAEQALTVISKIHGNRQVWQLDELDVVLDALKRLQELEQGNG